jgi:hypothetical protein
MKLPDAVFTTIDWEAEDVHENRGGLSRESVRSFGELRVRIVTYDAGYVADHWCGRGHVLHVIEGTLDTELADGRRFRLTGGMSYVVSDGDPPHRSSTQGGARLFIVD